MAGTDVRRGRVASIALLAVGIPLALSLLAMDDVTALRVRFALVSTAPIAILWGVHAHRPARPAVWYLLFGGLLLFQAGDVLVLRAVSDVTDGTNLAADSWLTAAGAVLFLSGGVAASWVVRGRDVGGSLDALTAAIATGMVLWQGLIVAAAVPGWAGSGLEIAGSLQVLLLMAVGALVVRATVVIAPEDRYAAVLLSIAVLLAVVGFLIGAVRDSTDLAMQYGGSRATVGALSTLMVAAAVVHHSMRALTTRVVLPPDRFSVGRLLGYGLALLVPVAIVSNASLRSSEVAWVTLLLGWIVLVPTVLGRVRLLAQGRASAVERAVDSERRLRSLLSHTSDVLLLVTPVRHGRSRIVYASPAVERVLAIDPTTLIDANPFALVDADHGAALGALLDGSSDDYPVATDVRLPAAPDRWFDAVVDHGPLLPESGRTFVVTLRDVTDRKQAELAWVEAALEDPLTSLPNRRGVEQRMAALAGDEEPGIAGMGVLLCDLDGFKAVNDTHGHAAGDAVLVAFGRRLQGAVRGRDVVGRLGGDEFVVVCPDTTDRRQLELVAARIIDVVAEVIVADEVAHRVGVSLGAARSTHPAASFDLLLREADAALYRAKAAGRGRVVWSEDETVRV